MDRSPALARSFRLAPAFVLLSAALLWGGCNASSTNDSPPAEAVLREAPVPDPTGPKDAAVPEALAAPARWRLVELLGKPVARGEDPEREAAITFVRDGLVHGSGSCNRFKGRCEFSSDNRLEFSGIASTRMACADMTVEQEFFRALETADGYALRDGVLSLQRARMTPVARLEAVR